MAESPSLKREVILILLGAIISATTAFLTSSFDAKREDKRANIQKKMELNDQISKDIGKRLFLSYRLYKGTRDKDSTLNDALLQYQQSKEEWNLKIYSYQSLLKHYYGESIKVEFITYIYNPLIKLGQDAEYNRIDSTFQKRYIDLQNRNIEFISKIYDLTEK
ncbi:MAG: hypothetical protein EAY81_07655 [Bacteroidetes bacterium]|nr:MAG: hypothetical protein EAY81_07655 [Bacteroidota bacterium]